MDLIQCIKRLRPDVTWKNNMVNGHSVTSIKKTYQSSQPIPTEQECIDAWVVIKTEIEVEDVLKTQKVKNIKQAKIDLKQLKINRGNQPITPAYNDERLTKIEIMLGL